MTRFQLSLKALFFRTLQSIISLFDLYLSTPVPQRVAFKRRISSTVASVPGEIDLFFYTSASYTQNPNTKIAAKKHPLLINFHGGGFTIGHPKDDARWASKVVKETNAVVVSVDYRLAPEYPFPTGIEDCVSAILWLWENAGELGVDIERTALSGFSAGGNLCYAVSVRLWEELQRWRDREVAEHEEGKLGGLVVFYGSCDWTQSRVERNLSNPDLIPVIPLTLFRLFDESYLYRQPDMRSPLLSPGIAPDELLRSAFPEKAMMISCGGDQLLAESERFAQRLRGLGKKVDSFVVPGVGHGWDKKPTFWRGDETRDEAYDFAVKGLKEMWN